MKPAVPLILRGDARRLPLPDESVDLIVTSPPYFGLRSYTDGGEAYDGQIGAEATPREFIAALIACTREWMRVLKPSGSIFVNLGDKYSTYESRPGNAATHDWAAKSQQAHRYTRSAPDAYGVPYKSLMLLPERYRIACVDELGLIARAVLVWSKPNGMPESVTDRVRRSHEDWVHLTKSPRYFSAVDEIREPYEFHGPRGRSMSAVKAVAHLGDPTKQTGLSSGSRPHNPLGKLPGSVWEIATQPLRVPAELGVDHFAAFPMEWPRRLILGWSPREVCTACGEGRRPVSERRATSERRRGYTAESWNAGTLTMRGGDESAPARTQGENVLTTITGYACACPDTTAPSTPGVVLDPFGGTGTTALVAAMHGRQGVSVDASADYCRLAEWRAADSKERARAAGLDPDAVAAVRPQLPGQFDLFGEAS